MDKPEAPICLSFLVGTCKLGKRCSNHHCSLPYHWQYKVPNVDVWNSFSDKDNVTLERFYCDVNNTQMEFKPVETLDFSLTERYFVDIMLEFCWDQLFSFSLTLLGVQFEENCSSANSLLVHSTKALETALKQ